MRGVVLSLFPQGHGFVRPLDHGDWHHDGYFYHMNDSPELPDILYADFIGTIVDFEIIPDSGYRTRAVNLRIVESITPS